jgi:probable F420-dependent oxidoreductase
MPEATVRPAHLADTVGVWTASLEAVPASRAQELAAEIEQLGYSTLWFGEAYGREAFSFASLLLAGTRTLAAATGIASIYARDAVTANAAARTVAEAYPGRFTLGLGVSHKPIVERVRGHRYRTPIADMAEYLAAMDAAPYLAVGPEVAPPRLLAALGPRMLDLARDAADGAHPYLVTPEHTHLARERLGAGRLLAVEQAVVLTDDPEVAMARAHAHLDIYTGLPNYRNSWRRLGFDEEDFVRGGSDRLARALVVWGDEAAIAARVQEHVAAGADHVCIQALGDDVFAVPDDQWRRLAPALT